MYIKLVLLAVCAAFIFSSCGKEPQKIGNGEFEVVQSENEKTIFTEGNKITITSLQSFNEFNFDGNFSDNCLNFLRGFIEGNSEFEQFKSLKISNWEIIRDEKEYGNDLAFNFTIVASDIDTLPKGEYKTIVNDAVDCTMKFVSSPRDITYAKVEETPQVKAVTDWLNYAQYYDLIPYGEWENIKFANYIRCHYFGTPQNDKMKFSDFVNLAKDIFGYDASESDFNAGQLYIEDKTLYVTTSVPDSNPQFEILRVEEKDGLSKVYVQYYADCNRFIKSDQVAFCIDENLRFLNSEVISYSDYEPYGLRPTR